jgi:GT2 family glycosyltransferase
MENNPKKRQAPVPPASPALQFDEEIYLRLNPDVRIAVASGSFPSGRDHFERYGRAEGRPFAMPGPLVRDRVVMTGNLDIAREQPKTPLCAVDTVKISHSGGIFLAGWVNDALDRIDSIDLYFSGWSLSFSGQGLARLRREDAEKSLGTGGHAYGFWGFLYGARRLPGGTCTVVLRLKSGAEFNKMMVADMLGDAEMRDFALSHLAAAQYLGNPYFESVLAIETAIGEQLVDLNKMLSRRAVNAPYVERFGAKGKRYKGSFVVCLYGRPEYMFLQNAMFSRQPGIEDYEFIYISNSPYIAEQLLKEAKLCTQIYGLDMVVICLNSNAGFGAANNVAVEYASSDRIIIMNPDVFPNDAAWVRKHTELMAQLPPEQTALFGAPLYYDDGSLMHAGMYFCADTMPNFAKGQASEVSILRVEHYGKGAPPDTAQFLKPRPVPAVTGALISTEKAWFEKLGGFTLDYVFGHYEDADLCLKSLKAGCAPWLHDLRLWHLEGKGSTRKPEHEGGSAVNRWLFTKIWGESMQAGLLGPNPNLVEMAAAPEAPPGAPGRRRRA